MIITQETIPVLSEQLTLYSSCELFLLREGCMEEVVGTRFDLARSRLITRRDDRHE